MYKMGNLFGLDISRFSEVCIVIALALISLYVYLTWTYDFWKKRGVKYVEPVLFFGTIKDYFLARKCGGFILKDQYDMFPDERYVGGFRMREPYLLLRDLDLIKAVLLKDFDSFQDRVFPVHEEAWPLSAHLFNLKGRRWRALRAKLTPAFTSGKMKLMFNLMAECAAALTLHLDRQLEAQTARDEGLEMREALAQFNTDVIGSCAFGLQMNALADRDSEFRRAGRLMFAPSTAKKLQRLCVVFLPALARRLGLSFEGSEVTAFFTRAVREVVDFREKNDVKRGDFIDLLLQLKHRGKVEEDAALDQSDRLVANAVKSADDIEFTDNLLAAQVWVFFIAGFETSSTAASFALHELAVNPEYQERLREEIDLTIAANGGKLTYDSLLAMKYLDMVWNEALRKYPPSRNLVRRVTREYPVAGSAGLRLPRGLWVDVPVTAIHHDPRLYPQPQRFDPQRFSDEQRARRHPCAFLPFGEGPRICIGMRFGTLQGKLALATLLSKYRFSPCSRTRIPIRLDPNTLVTASKDGIWLKVEKR